MDGKQFTVTEEHVKLLRAMYVGWCDDEFGAPQIDPKRPYGNSDVLTDMAEELGLEFDSEAGLPDETQDWLRDLHVEMQTVLQVMLRCGALQPGTYATSATYKEDWSPAEQEAPVSDQPTRPTLDEDYSSPGSEFMWEARRQARRRLAEAHPDEYRDLLADVVSEGLRSADDPTRGTPDPGQ